MTKNSDEILKKLYKRDEVFFQHPISNFEESINFYKNIGLEVSKFSKQIDNYDDIGLFEFDLPVKGAILSLAKMDKEKLKPLDSLAISVHYLEDLQNIFRERGIKTTKIQDVPNLMSFFSVKDPDGNRIILISNPRVKSE